MPTVDCLQVAGRSPSPADHGQNPPSISPHGKTSLKVRLDDIRGRRDNDRGRRNTRRSRSRSRLWSRGSDIRNGGATPYHGASAEVDSQQDTSSDPRDRHRPGGGGVRLARAGRPGHAGHGVTNCPEMRSANSAGKKCVYGNFGKSCNLFPAIAECPHGTKCEQSARTGRRAK